MFQINEERCFQLGESLSSIEMSKNAFENLAPSLKDDNIRSLVFLYVSSICHQTETLEGHINYKFKRGWDYLMGKFIEKGTQSPSSLQPNMIKKISKTDLQTILSDNSNPKSSTISLVEGRVNILRDIAKKLEDNYCSNPNNLYDTGILSGKQGLYSKMKQFNAFGQDPIMKKATVFFMLMQKSQLWGPFQDPENLIPMPDYHKERLFLRTGCIYCEDENISKKLKSRETQDINIDNELRNATSIAYQKISSNSKHDFFELEVLLWSFARSFCYHNPICETSGKFDQGNFHEYANCKEIDSCPLYGICNKETSYWQPIVETTFH